MDETKYLPIAVHEEFARRVEDENERQNHRIGALETAMKDLNRITVSVEKLAVSMQAMAEEQRKQGARLDEIEKKPEKRWETIVGGVITGIIGILIGLLSAGLIK